jgi:hypothetical protein
MNRQLPPPRVLRDATSVVGKRKTDDMDVFSKRLHSELKELPSVEKKEVCRR